MALEWHQRRHLMASYLAVVELIEEMDHIAREGRATDAPGVALVPLPEEWWQRMAVPLTGIRERLREMVGREAPDELREHETAQPLSATVRRLSIPLLRLAEEIEGLEPDRVQRRYGALPDAAARDLAKVQSDLTRALERAREELGRPPSKAGQ